MQNSQHHPHASLSLSLSLFERKSGFYCRRLYVVPFAVVDFSVVQLLVFCLVWDRPRLERLHHGCPFYKLFAVSLFHFSPIHKFCSRLGVLCFRNENQNETKRKSLLLTLLSLSPQKQQQQQQSAFG